MTKRTVQFKIYRYDPDKDDKPYMQDISVELEPTDKKLLDALVRLRPRTTRCPSAVPAAKACAAPTR
jgi:succinate dehydrogenase / fumarate reductase iron-sulfur subunit